jgi:precorrin-8X/cobalt-precorrin-8 methylmutase
MKATLEQLAPLDIERRSFEIITSELPHEIDESLAPIIKRVIHTTADFTYLDALCFSEGVLQTALDAIKSGAYIVTDTTMAMAGINKRALKRYGGEVLCFIGDEDVARAAEQNGTTRSVEAMEKAASLDKPLIFAIGNAPTALVKLAELIEANRIRPALVIGVPVGFVNVVASKNLIMGTRVPYIVARGRKGGSNVAAAICNALLYMLGRE